MPMDVQQTLGKYEIRGTLGRGAMGTVYDGWDPLIARRVAIKTVSLPDNPDPETAEEIARFKREAQAAGRLTHPNIVAVYDYGETSDIAYIVMEFVDGPSLKGLLDKQERFALPELKRVMEDLLAGLQFSHERGVVHRDIKPANIMLTKGGQAKIADFGIARIEASSMTQAGTMLGTPAYMSPEQFMGQVVDARSDVYSAGVVLYQLLTGERPFDGGLTAIMHKVLNTEPPPPSQLAVTAPAALDAVVRRAMAKRPDDRFPSAAAFAEAIRAAFDAPPPDTGEATLIGSVPIPALQAPPSPSARPAPAAAAAPARRDAAAPAAKPSGSRVPLLAGVAVAALLAIGGGGFILTRPSPVATPPKPADTVAAVEPVAPPKEPPAQAPAVQPPPQSPPASQPSAPIVQAEAPATPQPVPQPQPQAQAPAQPAPSPAPTPAPQPAPAPQPQVQAQAPVQPPAPQVQPATPQVQPAPVQPAAPPPPSPQELAMAGLGPVRQMLEHASCAATGAVVQDSGTLSVVGVAGTNEVATLRQATTGAAGAVPLDWQVQGINPVFCTALDAVRPAALAPHGLRLFLADGRTALHDEAPILPRITMADFGGELRVDYLGHDGSVLHLFPMDADPANNFPSLPARHFNGGEQLALGDSGYLKVGPPFGTDMIVAVASGKRLLQQARKDYEENASTYLHELSTAIAQARAAGTPVAAALLPVDTLPK